MSSYTPLSVTAPSTPVRGRSFTVNKPSPRTPSSTTSTPYTTSPSSGRSFASSSLTTPSPIKYSPDSHLHAKSTKSIADLTENWRERAQLNGIKVSAAKSDKNQQKGSTSKYRRTIKQSPFSSPVSFSRRSNSTFNTPSPKANILQSLGSLTAPSEPRRRAIYDSPFSDISEDDGVLDSLPSPFPSLRAFRDLSSLEKPLPSPGLRDLNSSCCVCDKESSGSSRMIVLSPCAHVFCASCFTGTLNIVGEKNMSCMECQSPVESFHFALGSTSASSSEVVSPTAALLGKPFSGSTLFSAVPKPPSTQRSRRDGVAVLRIDNVPWDVTPIVIQKFIKHPIIQAHVLLDINGKTLSHAFVQLSLEDARAALRSTQNAILGDGRRARAVTVTLSSQEELMAALYPYWRGGFDGCEPSLDGLDNEQVNEALKRGLLSQAELNSLLTLITTPDSHFLKVPSLPFYSLISILSTFPSDVDSRVFWSGQLRDALFRVTHAAFQVLASRREESDEALELWMKLVVSGINCRVFTASQIHELELVVKTATLSSASDLGAPVDLFPAAHKFDPSSTVEALANQLGLDPNLLAAFLQSPSSFV